jgi:hypothetical protein
MIRPLRLSPSAGAVLVATMVLVIVSPLAPPPAGAHADPTIVVRLRDVQPDLPAGARLAVLDGEETYLAMVNSNHSPVLALDPDGEPFLRVSSRGVFGDLTSPYLQTTAGQITSASPVRLGCCPRSRWWRLSDKSGWAWADPRLSPPLLGISQTSGNRGLSGLAANQYMATWRLALQYGDKTMTATGVIERRPMGRVRTTIDEIPAGLHASVLDGRTPQLRLTTPAGTRTEVLGADGRAFVRMTPQGAFGRSASRLYRAHQRAIGLKPETGSPWVPMDSGGSTELVLADPRLSYWRRLPSRSPAEPVVLNRWRIPVVVNGSPGAIHGKSVWEPIPMPAMSSTLAVSGNRLFDEAASYLTAGLLTAGLALAYLLARRRARPPGDSR